MRRTRTGWGLLLFLGTMLFCLLGVREWKLKPDGHLHLHFLDVGQGDSTLLVLPHGQTILIDGGPDWAATEALGKFLPFFDRRIDLLVLSHANRDHLTSLPEILRRYRVGSLLLPYTNATLPQDGEILTLARQTNTPVFAGKAGDILPLPDGAAISILWPPEHLPQSLACDPNDASLVLKILYGKYAALFAGDIGTSTEKILTQAHADLQADILKVPHHGSRSSSSTGFLLAIHPSLAVVSVGTNAYGHPHFSVLRRIQSLGARVHRTDHDGPLDVVW